MLLLVILLLIFFLVWYITGISPKQRNRKARLYVKHVSENEIYVRIESFGKLPIEILAPEIKFYNRDSFRAFAVKSPGQNLFPLSLFPLTDYEFKLDLGKFYDHDTSLQQYKRIRLVVREKTGRLLKSKRIWV